MENLVQFGKIISINNQFGVLRASVAILSDEVPEDVILVSNYGQNGNPPIAGATCLVFSPFGQEIKFGIPFNANTAPVIQAGEAIIYNDKGSKIYLKQDGTIDITANNVKITGNLEVTGNSTLTGTGTTIAGRNFLTHQHSGVQAGGATSGGVV